MEPQLRGLRSAVIPRNGMHCDLEVDAAGVLLVRASSCDGLGPKGPHAQLSSIICSSTEPSNKSGQRIVYNFSTVGVSNMAAIQHDSLLETHTKT